MLEFRFICFCLLQGDLLDVVSVNRYFGWYEEPGQTEVIGQKVWYEYHAWHTKYHKPVLVTEYGAGAVAGLHSVSFILTQLTTIQLSSGMGRWT